MNKHFCIILAALLILMIPLGGCTAQNVTYVLDYKAGSLPVISNTSKDGSFYVLENKIVKTGAYGNITIESCYYEYGLGYNVYYTLETDKPEEIERMANDSEHSLYGKASINKKTMELTTYGYNIVNEYDDSGTVLFELESGYKQARHSPKDIVIFEFSGERFEIELTKTQGYSVKTQQGRKLWESITAKQ